MAVPISVGVSVGHYREVAIAGTPLDLATLADLLTSPTQIEATGPAIPFYPIRVDAVAISRDADGPAQIQIANDNAALRISGGANALALLAENIRSLAVDGDPGDHLHLEHVPGHFFLGEASIATTVELLPPA